MKIAKDYFGLDIKLGDKVQIIREGKLSYVWTVAGIDDTAGKETMLELIRPGSQVIRTELPAKDVEWLTRPILTEFYKDFIEFSFE